MTVPDRHPRQKTCASNRFLVVLQLQMLMNSSRFVGVVGGVVVVGGVDDVVGGVDVAADGVVGDVVVAAAVAVQGLLLLNLNSVATRIG